MSKVAISGNASGTGTFTIQAPNSNTDRVLSLPDEAGTVLTGNSSLNAANLTGTLPAIDGSALTGISGGKILQVVPVTKTTTYDSTATSFTNITGLSVTITPSSTSSYVLIMANLSWSGSFGDEHFQLRLARGGSPIYVGSSAGSRTSAFTGVYSPNYPYRDSVASSTAIYRDAPSSTSALTYTVQMRTSNGGTFYLNRTVNDDDSSKQPRTASSLIAMEIEG